MLSTLYRSILITILLALILCGAYPLAVTAVAKVVFNQKADGSLIVKENQIVGSELLGQTFSDPKYFHGRPSAAGAGYDASSSSGSNLGPTSQKLADNIKANIKKVLEENPEIEVNQIPVDLVTASSSGLDPHISPEAALLQAKRIASIRGLSVETTRQLIEKNTEGPQWGIFGDAGVNVLKLNYALDTLAPVKSVETKPESVP